MHARHNDHSNLLLLCKQPQVNVCCTYRVAVITTLVATLGIVLAVRCMLSAADQHPLTTAQKRALLLAARCFFSIFTFFTAESRKIPPLPAHYRTVTHYRSFPFNAILHRWKPKGSANLRSMPAQCHSSPLKAEGSHRHPLNCRTVYALPLISAWKWPFWATILL